MELKEFIDHFASEFDDTPADIFTSETHFKELDEWSSLTILSIISMIDEEMEVRITGSDIRNCETIKDLYELAKSKKNV